MPIRHRCTAQASGARAMMQKARRQVADLAGAQPDHIVFTSGATEAAATLLAPHWSMGRAPLTIGRAFMSAQP